MAEEVGLLRVEYQLVSPSAVKCCLFRISGDLFAGSYRLVPPIAGEFVSFFST
jgi:hypothetical protein